jgi:predicted transcriptional regulator
LPPPVGAEPGPVRTVLGKQLAYTTVTTTLSRLHAKGAAVTRQLAGRGFSYELSGGPAGAQASIPAHRMHQLLVTGSDRAGVLSRFVADLSSEDEQLLLGLLADSGQSGSAGGKSAYHRAPRCGRARAHPAGCRVLLYMTSGRDIAIAVMSGLYGCREDTEADMLLARMGLPGAADDLARMVYKKVKPQQPSLPSLADECPE